VRGKGFQETGNKQVRIALLEQNDYLIRRMLANKKNHHPQKYADVQGCIDAVIQGKADETFLYTYTAQKALLEDERNKLKMAIIPGTATGFALLIADRESHLLGNILNKGVQSMNNGDADNIILAETSSLSETTTVLSFIYDRPLVALAIMFVLALLAIGLILSLQHSRNVEQGKQRAEEAKSADEAKNKILQDALTAALQANETKGAFLSRMSHEIRTPLNAVLGFLDLAKLEHDSPPLVNEYVNKCIAAGEQLLAIINDVLDMSAIERGKLQIAAAPYNMEQLVQEVERLFAGQARHKGLKFTANTVGIAGLVVIGDQLRLNQILTNLLSNAIKFTNKGGKVQLTAEIVAVLEDKLRIKFTIKDSGIGMEAAFLKHLFEPFNQASATTAQKYGGSGLGLSITKNLVNMMQGSLDVASTPNQGSIFTLVLTLPKGEQIAPGQTGKVPKTKASVVLPTDLQGLRVLLVEDNFVNREIALKLLAKVGAIVTTVGNGQEAVDKFLQAQPGTFQLILMDIQMPVLDGYAATRKIRASHHPDAQKISIIAMTANAFNEDVTKALAAGMNGHLAKPINLQAFYRILQEAKERSACN